MRWEGVVDALTHGEFWARVRRLGGDSLELEASFERSLLPHARVGMLFTLYVHRRGRRVRTVLRPKAVPPVTAEQIEQARRWVQETMAALGRHPDQPVTIRTGISVPSFSHTRGRSTTS